MARHCLERYGEEEVSSWLWELWNEPDIYYWRGTPEQFNELYTVTAKAIRSVLPNGKVGGPTVTSGGLEFMKGFLEYTSSRNEPLDFVSFHTKGCRFPTRDYRPIGAPAKERLNPSSTKMLFDLRSFNRAIAEFEQYRDLPAIVDECDAAVPAHFGRYDNANYEFQNTEYYPVFQVKLMKKILDLNATEIVSVAQATSWSFYFEGERYFEGTRSFLTAGGIEKPLPERLPDAVPAGREPGGRDLERGVAGRPSWTTPTAAACRRRSTAWPPATRTARSRCWSGATPTTSTRPTRPRPRSGSP